MNVKVFKWIRLWAGVDTENAWNYTSSRSHLSRRGHLSTTFPKHKAAKAYVGVEEILPVISTWAPNGGDEQSRVGCLHTLRQRSVQRHCAYFFINVTGALEDVPLFSST
jgi:hypothetical protein